MPGGTTKTTSKNASSTSSRVYLNEDAARAERERLHAENSNDDIVYFVQETELERSL